MVMDLLDSLLNELGAIINVPQLHTDRNNTCLIKLAIGVSVQLELRPNGQSLLMGSDLGQVVPGRYRTNIFREALKTNCLPYPLHGILGFSKKKEHLVLFQYLPVKELTGEKIAEALTPFSEKALKWKAALERAEVPLVASTFTSSGMFGMRR